MKEKTNNRNTNRIYYWLLAAIMALAFMLRIAGITWGLPHTDLHPDEGIIFGKAYECASQRTFEVSDYYYRPNHVLIKLNTLVYIGLQDLYFSPKGLDDFGQNFGENITLFVVASRMISVLFGVGVVAVAFFIARRWGMKQALITSLLFAVFPPFVEHSHYITPDMALLFFLMCVMLEAIRYVEKPSASKLFWMAFFTALATCEKFPGAYGCVLIATAVCLSYYKQPFMILREGVMAILFYIAGIMAVSPILIIDYKDVMTAVAGQNGQYHLGGDGLNFRETIWYYLKTTGIHAGLILTISSAYGIIKGLRKNLQNTVLLLVFFLYLIPISVLKVHWERYTLPLYAVCLFFASFGVCFLYDELKSRFEMPRVVSIVVSCILFLLPIASLFAGSLAVCGSFMAPDSRYYLQNTFAEMGINSINSTHDCNTPMDPGGYYGAFSDFDNWDPKTFRYGKISYIVTSSSQRDLYLESNQEMYGAVAEFYRKLDNEHNLIYVYTPENPSSHFVELQNIWYAARSVHRYLNGVAAGYEIRLYQIVY